MNLNSEQHERTLRLLGKKKARLLSEAHVLIVGLGGVGSYAAEHLCRAGIGKLTLVDPDKVQTSNINRQLIALHSTVGQAKCDVMLQRLQMINPEAHLEALQLFVNEENMSEVFKKQKYNYVIDAIDTLSPKTALIEKCLQEQIPLVSSMGAGGRLHPELVQVDDISKTHHCHLARMVRKRLHRKNIYEGFRAVFSTEIINPELIIKESGRNKNTNVGTISYMPALFGLYCAATVINDLSEEKSSSGN
ncbi:MAG: tRNA threonylcarbamoyladenosine dehydratase [Bacteroidia bacterium]|nr:MAG: tRNA threonylcarbamoyladenosine dehydratase [Bacteroidia bacterium]